MITEAKATTTKKKQMGVHQIKKLLHAMATQAIIKLSYEKGKIFAYNTSYKGLIHKI